MNNRVRMDWLLFGTILGLTALGLVMVYSASALMPSLRRAPRAQKLAAGPTADQTATAPSPAKSEEPARRPWARQGVAVGVVCLALLALGRRYAQGKASKLWLGGGGVAAAVLLMLAFGFDGGAEAHYGFVFRQALAALVGLLFLMVLAQRDYRTLEKPQVAFSILGVVIFLLMLTYVVGGKSHRWLNFGISLQPSEFAKPALAIFLAWLVAARRGIVNHRHTMWPAALAFLVVGGLVIVPDFGTALVLVVMAAAVFCMAGLNWRYTATALALGPVLLGAAILMQPHRVRRLVEYADPEYKSLSRIDPEKKLLQYAARAKVTDTRYQPEQALIAVSSGGVFGRGLMNSRQKLLFLPEAHTDYIYAVIGEELGLAGATLVLLGFMVILWRGYRLFLTATDDFGQYLAVGATTAITFQALLNMSVVLSLGPTKGIPLPLLSFGGSSMVSTMILLGLLLSVSQRSTAH